MKEPRSHRNSRGSAFGELADHSGMMSPGELIKALDELAVGLVMVGCQLGEKLVVRNAGRRGQASLVEDAGADFRRRRGRRSTVLVLVGRDLRMLAHCGASPNCVERLSATLITGAANSRKRPPTNEAAATGRSANLKYRSPVGQALGQAILIYLVIASSPVTAQDARPVSPQQPGLCFWGTRRPFRDDVAGGAD